MKRLQEIQQAISVNKPHYNDYGGFNFYSVENILNKLKPLLKEGETITLNDRIVFVGERYYIASIAKLTLIEESNPVICTCEGWSREPDKADRMNESQTTGSASSYARKRALSGLLALDSGDLDADQVKPDEEKQELIDKIKELLTPEMEEKLKNSGKKLEDYSNQALQKLIDRLEKQEV